MRSDRRRHLRHPASPRKIWVIAGDGNVGAAGALADLTVEGLSVRFDRRSSHRLLAALEIARAERSLVHLAGLSNRRDYRAHVVWIDVRHPTGSRIGLELVESLDAEDAARLSAPKEIC